MEIAPIFQLQEIDDWSAWSCFRVPYLLWSDPKQKRGSSGMEIGAEALCLGKQRSCFQRIKCIVRLWLKHWRWSGVTRNGRTIERAQKDGFIESADPIRGRVWSWRNYSSESQGQWIGNRHMVLCRGAGQRSSNSTNRNLLWGESAKEVRLIHGKNEKCSEPLHRRLATGWRHALFASLSAILFCDRRTW